MSQQNLENEIDRIRSQLSSSRKSNIVLVIISIILAATTFKLSDKMMVTMVPPEINKSFWVSNSGASEEYLEEMALFVSQLTQNHTPKNIDYKHEQFLKYVHPSSYGSIKSFLDDQAEYVKSNNVSQIYHPDSARIDIAQGIVQLTGVRERWVNEEPLPSKQIVLRVSFDYDSGLISVKQLKEKENG